jgi:hypothetical protein
MNRGGSLEVHPGDSLGPEQADPANLTIIATFAESE